MDMQMKNTLSSFLTYIDNNIVIFQKKTPYYSLCVDKDVLRTLHAMYCRYTCFRVKYLIAIVEPETSHPSRNKPNLDLH